MENLKKTRVYLKTLLDHYKQATEAAPEVQRALDVVEWEDKAISEAPEHVRNSMTSSLESQFNRQYTVVTSILPMIPNYDPTTGRQLTTITTSGDTNAYAVFVSNRDQFDAVDPKYFPRHDDAYRTIQLAHDRLNELRDAVRAVAATLVPLLEKAVDVYDSACSGASDLASAALETRTLIEKAKGELFDKARQWTKENMTWSEMAARLSPRDTARLHQNTLIEQGSVHTQLVSKLSDILKQRQDFDTGDLQQAWTLAVDHLYVVFRAVIEASR